MIETIRPEHYKENQFECIEVMADVFGTQAVRNFCRLNAFKYVWRADHKGGVSDLKKARFYIEKEIEFLEQNHAPSYD